MDNERNINKPRRFFRSFKNSNRYAQRNKRKASPYSKPEKRRIDERIKKGRFSSPEKQGEAKDSAENVKISENINDDIPDRSYGDFYCKACDSHMSSELTWDCHIQGKRHLKNTKRKGPDSEYEFVDQDPIMLPEMKKIKKPLIGLQHCCEMLHPSGPPTYQCFLCSACIPNSKLLIEHVIGLKHRMAYLKLHDSVSYGVIMKTELKKGMIEPVVEEFIQKYQDKHGLGKMRVKVAKQTSSFNNPARPYKDDLSHKKTRIFSRSSYDDVRNEIKSEDSDWKHSRNYEDDVRNESKSEDSNWKLSRNYDDDDDDERSESKSEDSDWRHSRNYDDDVRNESKSEESDWRLSKNSYDDVRTESVKTETDMSDWRQISGKAIDYHSKDNFASELHCEKSVLQHDPYNKIEIAFSNRRSATPPINSKVNYEEREANLYPNLTWNISDHFSQSEDLRVFLEKKRMLETTMKTVPIAPNNTNDYDSVLSLIEDLPTMKFLELVQHKVEKLDDPSETELNMLSKIGKIMFSIVMKKKIDMLTPDLRKKYQSVTNENLNQSSIIRTATPEQKSTNKTDFQSLLDLIKNPKRESEKPLVNHSFPLQNISSQLGIASTSTHQPVYLTESPNFIRNLYETPSSSSTSSLRDFSAIPGLTLPTSQEISSDSRYSYPHDPSQQVYDPKLSAWQTLYKDNLNQY